MPPDELAYCKRIVDARRGTGRMLPAVELAVQDRQEHAPEAVAPGVSEMRARLAAARERNEAEPGGTPVRHRKVAGVPPEAMAVLMRLLAAPEGTTANEAGLALGKSKETAREYLTALRDRGLAQLTGGGRGSRWRRIRAEPPAAPEPPPYLTIEALAQYVVEGLVDADDEQRAVLEHAHDLIRRQRLTLVQGGGGDAQ
jgi:hypothetical protein